MDTLAEHLTAVYFATFLDETATYFAYGTSKTGFFTTLPTLSLH